MRGTLQLTKGALPSPSRGLLVHNYQLEVNVEGKPTYAEAVGEVAILREASDELDVINWDHLIGSSVCHRSRTFSDPQ